LWENDALIVKGVNDADVAERNKKLESKIDVFTTFVTQLATNKKATPTKVCGICTSHDHFIDAYLAMQQQQQP